MSVLLKRRQSASPPTLQPLTFTSDLTTMIHEQRPHQTVTFNHLAVPAEQHHHSPQRHAQSDSGHGSPPNHSLLRHFSLRSRNSFTLRMSRHQNRVLPPPPLASYSKPENVRTDSSSTASRSHSHSTNGSSDVNLPSSIWKKWRVRSVSEYSSQNASLEEEGPVTGHHDAISSPMTQHAAPVRKRSLFLPFLTLVVPFQISLSSPEGEDSSVVVSQSPRVHQLHNQDDKKLNGFANGNPSSWDEHEIGLIRQADGWVEVETHHLDTNRAVPDALPSLPATSSTPPNSPPLPALPPPSGLPSLPLLPLPLNSPTTSKRHVGCKRDVDPDVDLSLLALLVEFDGDVPGLCSGQGAEQVPSIVKEDLPCTPVDALNPVFTIDTSGPPPSSSTSNPKSTLSRSNPQPSNDLNPNLKSSISQKRRAKFTLGDESDLDSDLLGVSASVSEVAAAAARREGPRALSSSGSTPVHAVVPSNNSAQTTTTAMGIHRPPLTRRERLIDKTRDQNGITTSRYSTGTDTGTKSTANCKNTRRWTLSSALTDESISDEGLMKELERMREILEWDCTPIDMDGHDTSFVPSPSTRLNSSPTWLTTQRALLTTRELILTERHYLSSLLLLLCPDSTLTPAPEMMVLYVKELVGVSERLLKGMEEEPSVRGVAEVFVEVGGVCGQMAGDEDKGAERAFVGWCGVVGGWFQDDLAASGDTQAVVGVKRRRKRLEGGVGGIGGEEHHLISDQEGSSSGLGLTSSSEHAHTSPLMRTVSTLRMSMPSIAGISDGGVWRRDRDKDRERNKDEGDPTYGRGHGHRGRMSPTSFTTGAIGSSSYISMTSSSSNKAIRKPSVRDLAILPTQRVMRYVLLYRDLLANTPLSSSSYPIVERAVEVACRIAEKCDQAQGNSTFIAGGSAAAAFGNSSSGSSNSILNDGSNDRRSRRSKRKTLPETNLKLKTVWGSTASSSTTSNSVTSSPTQSHFPSSFSPSQSPSKLPSTSIPPSSPSKSTPTPSSLPLPVAKPIPPPPPSSFHSKTHMTRSGQSFGSSSTSSVGSSTTTTTATSSSSSSPSSSPFSSLPSSSALFLPKPASSSSSRMPKSLSAISLMSLVNGLGRSVSGPVGAVADSGSASAYASASPTKIEV